MVERLREDHARARRLAESLGKMRGLSLDAGSPFTNMIFLSLAESVPQSAKEVAEQLKARGVLAGVVGARRFRLVLHCQVDDIGAAQAVSAFKEVAG
jgi:threonine aldolase